MERRSMQPTFLDAATADLGSRQMSEFFKLCDEHVPWGTLAAPLEGLYSDEIGPGRPHWPVVLMLKVIMLKKWFGLSDPQAEEQIRDRLSFRRFLGLSLEDATPDHSTIRLFNEHLRETGHVSTLFDGVLEHLRQQGLLLNEGRIVDATIVQAARGSRRRDGASTRDPAATSTSKHNRAYFGFRAHVSTDTRGVLTDYRFDTARTSEHAHVDDLLAAETTAGYADSGYMKLARTTALRDRGVFPGIMFRRVRGQPVLTTEQLAHNRACAKIRAVVEHPFAWMRQMGYRIRYRGLSANAADFGLTAAAYNLKRMFSLIGRPLTPLNPAT